MAVVAGTDVDTRNRIARLWSNKETRSVIVQILTVAVLFAVIALVFRNVSINLAAI